MDRIAALPGVIAVGAGGTAPFLPRDRRNTNAFRQAGRPENEAESVRTLSVTEGYFDAMGIRLLRGRNFRSADGATTSPFSRNPPRGPRPVVISRELERRLFGVSGVGRQLVTSTSASTYDVVGVVEDVRWRQHTEPDTATIYLFADRYRSASTFVVRTASDPGAMLPAVRETLARYDGNIVITATATMDGLLARSIADERFRAALSVMFGVAALVLSAMGLYGLCVRRVADRRREIAVRVALGARPDNVRALVFRDAWRTVAVGVAVGAPAAAAAAHVARNLIAGLPALSARTIAVPALVLGIAAIMAMVLPARRAARIDPLAVLKE